MGKFLNTEEFIHRAFKKHGSMYDYSKVTYINSKTKVCIVCPKHGDFFQEPSAHIYGKGCFYCRHNSKLKTVEKFILEASVVHHNNYDYSDVFYKNGETKVCIKCPQHGHFYQTPANHLSGSICPKCAMKNRIDKKNLTTEIFIKRSNLIHGEGKFDYSKTVYKKARDKVCIICYVHGEFYQLAISHLSGLGCKKCDTDQRRLKVSEFINRANKLHGNKYTYDAIKFKCVRDLITIKCPVHGNFLQNVDAHLAGHGCPRCAYINNRSAITSNTEEFIGKAKKIHGYLYNYFEVDYIKSNKKVCIICNIHGKFYQKPNLHLAGHGCSICKASKGEIAVKNWLEKNKINFYPQYSFPDFKSKRGRLFEFDFFIPDKNLLIEFDGEQHFRPVQFHGLSINRANLIFERAQYNDSLKNDYCFKKSTPLLRIPYTNFKRIPEILCKNILNPVMGVV